MVYTLVAYILQGEHQLDGLQMPLADQRASNGHLFCQEVADVPDKTVLPLKFPLHLGSLSLPVSVRLVIAATVKLLSYMMQLSLRRWASNDGTSQTTFCFQVLVHTFLHKKLLPSMLFSEM